VAANVLRLRPHTFAKTVLEKRRTRVLNGNEGLAQSGDPA
jgi:hypothetical protein